MHSTVVLFNVGSDYFAVELSEIKEIHSGCEKGLKLWELFHKKVTGWDTKAQLILKDGFEMVVNGNPATSRFTGLDLDKSQKDEYTKGVLHDKKHNRDIKVVEVESLRRFSN